MRAYWWCWQDSNLRMSDRKSGELSHFSTAPYIDIPYVYRTALQTGAGISIQILSTSVVLRPLCPAFKIRRACSFNHAIGLYGLRRLYWFITLRRCVHPTDVPLLSLTLLSWASFNTSPPTNFNWSQLRESHSLEPQRHGFYRPTRLL